MCQYGSLENVIHFDRNMTYAIFFWLLYYLMFLYKIIFALTIADKGITPLQRNSVAIQLFIDIFNKNSGVCKIYSKVKKCCLVDGDDCDLVHVYTPQTKIVKAQSRKRFIFIFPSIYQHDLIGFCNIALIYKCTRKAGILNVHIPLDTRVVLKPRSNTLFKDYTNLDRTCLCKTRDLDSLNKCSPTDCDVKYNGRRSFYNKVVSKCIKAPICIASVDDDLPNIVYDAQINICKDLDVLLSVQDIYKLSSGLGVLPKKTFEKEKASNIEVRSNCSTISQNLFLLKDLMCGKLCPCKKRVDLTDLCKDAVLCIIFGVVSISVALLIFVFCIHASVWLLTQWLDGNVKNFISNVKSKFERIDNTCRDEFEVMDLKQNILLREIVAKEIPLHVGNSAVSVCEGLQNGTFSKTRNSAIVE